jgi:hypothetical protein
MPQNLWAEAIIAPCYIKNRFTSSIYRLLTKKTRKLIIARDVKFDETLLGFGNLRTKVKPLHIYDDDDEKKARKLVLKMFRNLLARKLKSVLRRSLRLQAK